MKKKSALKFTNRNCIWNTLKGVFFFSEGAVSSGTAHFSNSKYNWNHMSALKKNTNIIEYLPNVRHFTMGKVFVCVDDVDGGNHIHKVPFMIHKSFKRARYTFQAFESFHFIWIGFVLVFFFWCFGWCRCCTGFFVYIVFLQFEISATS